jgi:phosphocarrier protein FPr
MIVLEGITLVSGSAAGAAIVIQPEQAERGSSEDTRDPRERFAEARQSAAAELRRRIETLNDEAARQILRAHLALMTDPMLLSAVATHIDAGFGAAAAIGRARTDLVARFEALKDPVLRARAADLSDVCGYFARHFEQPQDGSGSARGRVVCAVELSPAQLLELAGAPPVAFALESRADTSHAAILLRALGVPAIVGVERIASLVRNGDRLLVDANQGRVILDPGADDTIAASTMTRIESDCDLAQMQDGTSVAVTATIAGPADVGRAMRAGADGVGLFRTEWLFLRRERWPSEDEQFEAYRDVARLAEDRPVTVRIMDLGGDKQPPALRLPVERNPALGLRGVRLALAYPDLLDTQIRALVRAFGRALRVMLPMVIDPGEVLQVRRILDRVASGSYKLGAMIETPAAALMSAELAAVTDFLSLGTNDLAQYVLAADRESQIAAPDQKPVHPAILRLIRLAAADIVRAGRPLSVCGEYARDPLVAPILVGMGVRELSVAPDAIVATKRLVRQMSTATARALGDELASLPTATAARDRLAAFGASGSGLDVHATRDAR